MSRVTFARADGEAWGVGLFQDGAGMLLATPGDASGLVGSSPVAARLERHPEQGWTVTGENLQLRILPAGAGRELSTGGGVRAAYARCEVAGTADGIELAAESPATGLCIEHSGWSGSEVHSIREVSAWFREGVDYALLALRPRKAKGHDRDLVLAALLPAEDEPGAAPVEDGRLSSVYGAGGEVSRAGLELWLEEEQGDGDTQEEAFPHRVAGERIATPVTLSTPGFSISVAPFRWHARGREGFGSYGLGGPR